MAESLRSRQKRVAREVILDAFTDEIVERGVGEVSLQGVADRAGVSSRTLYNYFESREALNAALVDRLNARSDAADIPKNMGDFDRTPDAIRHYFTVWAEHERLARAVMQVFMASIAQSNAEPIPSNDTHSNPIREAITALQPDLDDGLADAMVQIIRMLGSSRTWYRMTIESGIPAEFAAEASAWAFTTLRDAVKSGNLPQMPSLDRRSERSA